MSQEDLEERTGFTQSYISQVETGKTKRPNRARLQRFAEGLSIPGDALPLDVLLIAADYAPSSATRVAASHTDPFFRDSSRDIAERMSPEDRAVYEALRRKYNFE